MVYPYFSDTIGFRKKLIDNKIYTAQYWPNVLTWTKPKDIEYILTEKILHIPIDQRYSEISMNKILNELK